jgi:hypothetical protein
MRKIRILCIDCGKQVVISSIQPCFYCGRRYAETEVEQMLNDARAELVEMDKFLDEKIPLLPPAPMSSEPAPMKKVVYFVLALSFLVFCMICVLVAYRILK